MALTDLTRISTSGIATGTSLSGAILHGDAHFRGTQIGVTSALFDSSDNALEFNDNVKIKLGNSGDLELTHNGTDSIIDNNTGDLLIKTTGSGDDIISTAADDFIVYTAGGKHAIHAIGDGQVELWFNNNKKIETTNHGAVVTGILTATGFSGPLSNPSGISTFYDLRVTNNLTVEGSTTTLDTNLIGVDRVEVGANSNSIVGVAVTQSGTADLVNLFDGATKVVTVDDVGNVGLGSAIPAAKLDVNGTSQFKDDVTFKTSNTTSGGEAFWDYSDGSLRFNDNVKAKFGNGYDFQIYHHNNENIIGSLSGSHPIKIQTKVTGSTENGIVIIPDGAVELYHDNVKRFETNSVGVKISSDILVGNGTDLEIKNDSASETLAKFINNGAVELYHNNVKKLETNSSGIKVSGDIRVGNGSGLSIKDDSASETLATFNNNGAVELYHNNNLRVQTQTSRTVFRGSAGIAVYGDEGQNQNGQISIHPQGSAVYSNLFFYNAAGNTYASIIGHAGGTLFFTGGTNSPLRFRVNGTGHHSFQDGNTEKVRITVSGEVNIGGNFTQTTVPLCVTTDANSHGIRLMTGSNVVCDILNNDAAGSCEIRGYYNNNSGTQGAGFKIESNGETFFSPGGTQALNITSDGQVVVSQTLYITDTIQHHGDNDTKIRFPSNDQISFETAGVDRGRFDNDGNFLIGTTGHGNAGAGARHLVISGPSNQGLTINSTNTSGIYRDCNIYFGYGTSTTDMARGQFTYSGNGDYFHMSLDGSSYTMAKSFRLSKSTARFDSTPTSANAMSMIIKSHKARAVNDRNGICFLDAGDHTQAVINVEKKSTSNATSDLVFRTSSGQTVNTLQGIPERMRITSSGELRVPAGIGAQLRFENQHSVTTDAVISTYDDAAGTLLSLGSNYYFNSSGAETRYNTSEESAGITLNRNGMITLSTGGTGATAVSRLRIDSDGRTVVGGTTAYIGGANLAVIGSSDTINSYGCFAIGKIGANPSAGTTLANIRLNGGSVGTRRGAEINAIANGNWTDGSSHPTKLTFAVANVNSASATERYQINHYGHHIFTNENVFSSNPGTNSFKGLSQHGYQHWGQRQYYSGQVNLTQNQYFDLFSNNTAHDDIIFWLNIKGFHGNRTFATAHGTIGGYGLSVSYQSASGVYGAFSGVDHASSGGSRRRLRWTSTSPYSANWWIWGWFSGTSLTTTHTGYAAAQNF